MSFNEIDDTLVAYFKQMLDEETAQTDESSKEGLTETEKELSALQQEVTPIENDEIQRLKVYLQVRILITLQMTMSLQLQNNQKFTYLNFRLRV